MEYHYPGSGAAHSCSGNSCFFEKSIGLNLWITVKEGRKSSSRSRADNHIPSFMPVRCLPVTYLIKSWIFTIPRFETNGYLQKPSLHRVIFPSPYDLKEWKFLSSDFNVHFLRRRPAPFSKIDSIFPLYGIIKFINNKIGEFSCKTHKNGPPSKRCGLLSLITAN